MKIVNARIAYLRKDQKEKYAKSRLTQYGIVHNGVAERSEGSTITIAGASPAKAQTGNDLIRCAKGNQPQDGDFVLCGVLRHRLG